MKRSFYALGLMLAATFTLTNCTKEIDAPVVESEGVPFEIVASTVDTKTTNNGFATAWADGDQINLFHAVAGTTGYENDAAFTVEDVTTGLFKGTLTGELTDGETYDWYALYPYESNVSTPANQGTKGYLNVGAKVQIQNGNSNMDHVSGVNFPLAGIAKNVACVSTPTINMHHLASLVHVQVTNNSSAPLTVSSVTFTGTEDIVGTFFIDFTDMDAVKYKSSGANYVTAAATLAVEDGEEIPVNGTADFYIGIKPFTAEAESKLSLGVNTCIKEIELDESVSFTAGKIKTLKFSYVDTSLPKGISSIKSEATEAGSSFAVTLENAVVTYVNGSNAYIEDDNAGILIYLKNHGLQVGDCLNGDVSGTVVLYNNLREITAIDLSEVEKTTGAEVPVTVLTLAELNAVDAYDKYENMRIKVEGVEVSADKTICQDSQTYTLYYKNSSVKGFDVYNIIDAIGYPGKYKDAVQFNVWEDATVKGATKTVFTGFAETLSVGVGATLSNKAVPSSGADVTYTSSAEGVAIVDSEGNVTGVTAGTATITASVAAYNNYPAATATCEVTVPDPNAVKVEKEITFDFGTDEEVSFSAWDNSYVNHTASYEMATVSFESANKQSSTITDCPVTKGKSVSIVMKGNRTIKEFKLTLSQWNTKTQTVTLNYSTDGGINYTKSSVTSSNFSLSSEDLASLAEGVNAIKFTFSSSSNQVGIKSCYLKYEE